VQAYTLYNLNFKQKILLNILLIHWQNLRSLLYTLHV